MESKAIKVFEIIVPLEIKKLKGGDYLATSHVLRGLVAEGRTLAETLEIAQDVARKLIVSYQEHGDPLPAGLRKQMKRRSKTSRLQIPVAVNY